MNLAAFHQHENGSAKGKQKLPSLSICIYIIALLYFASFCRLLKVDNELLRKEETL